MFDKALEELTLSDIKSLIDNGTTENRKIEYKQQLNIANFEEKKELLRDISAFANSGGGDIIFGIKETQDEEHPYAICGILWEKTEDELNLILQDIIRHGTEPGIINTTFKMLYDEKRILKVYIVHIPESIFKPHRVILKNDNGFYVRTATGRQSMAMNDLRIAFGYSNDIRTRLENYDNSRLASISEDAFSFFQKKRPIVIFHAYPFEALTEQLLFTINDIETIMRHEIKKSRHIWNMAEEG